MIVSRKELLGSQRKRWIQKGRLGQLGKGRELEIWIDSGRQIIEIILLLEEVIEVRKGM